MPPDSGKGLAQAHMPRMQFLPPFTPPRSRLKPTTSESSQREKSASSNDHSANTEALSNKVQLDAQEDEFALQELIQLLEEFDSPPAPHADQ